MVIKFNDREKFVLEAIIDYYLNSGEAIGSRTLVKKYSVDLSSATIRNIMSDLEDDGFICKLHTSSGRAPTSKGYKYYLEKLLEVKRLTQEEMKSVRDVFESKTNELEEILEKTSRLLSTMSNYAGVAVEPKMDQEKIRKVELVFVNEFTLMAVIVSEDSTVKTKKIYLDHPVTEKEIKEICGLLNKNLKNKNVNEIIKNIEKMVKDTVMEVVNDVVKNCFDENRSEIFIEGTPNVIQDVGREKPQEVMNLMKTLEEKDDMKKIFNGFVELYDVSKGKVNIILGDELEQRGLEDLSFMFSVYTLSDNSKGVIGVIGPKRMEYSKTAGILEYVLDEVNNMIYKIKEKK